VRVGQSADTDWRIVDHDIDEGDTTDGTGGVSVKNVEADLSIVDGDTYRWNISKTSYTVSRVNGLSPW
jgi:hypothetical protein